MMVCYYASDCGKLRNNNEDSFHINKFIKTKCKHKKGFKILKKNNFVSICDGMGGEELGDVASSIAIHELSKFNFKNKTNEELIDYIKKINDLVCNEINKRNVRMGSTLVSAIIKKDILNIYNLGDSRAYIFNGKLIQISKDHTIEKLNGKKKGALTQHLGIFKNEIELEPFVMDNIKLMKNNYVLLCSDGLYDMVSDEEISKILSSKINNLKKRNQLLERALENGGKDNITFLLIQCI